METMLLWILAVFIMILAVSVINYDARRRWESEMVKLICDMSEVICTSLSKESPEPAANSKSMQCQHEWIMVVSHGELCRCEKCGAYSDQE